ncbi:helix-turn-helix domain-containing protein [Streptomyces collinus]|uniref:helix-turn-helix domain-containing protein n=1 Tax=Streptomyces collinus TaxID=42684 RepID=UPI0034146735
MRPASAVGLCSWAGPHPAPGAEGKCLKSRQTERGRKVPRTTGGWTFLTCHARVLLAIAREPHLRLRDMAALCHISDRTAQRVVADLDAAGYLSRQREGRRTRYTLHLDGTLRHPAETHISTRDLVAAFTKNTVSTPHREQPAGCFRHGQC